MHSWLISAYDEYTEDEHGGTPEWHTETINKSKADKGNTVRELIITVPDNAVFGLFETPTVKATSAEPQDRTNQ